MVVTETVREIVEVVDTDPQVLHLIEPVLVGEFGSGGGGKLLFVEYQQSTPQSVWEVAFPEPAVAVSWSLYTASGREGDEYAVLPVDDTGCRVAMDIPTAGVIRLILRRTTA
ncbi:MAG: hypothetical protein H7Y15_09540 [Pseudonocardia sp.]|nr:hypothetical protein [Pseudonocardia sp.]